MHLNRRNFIINLTLVVLLPFFLLEKKQRKIKVVNGWLLKSEDFE